MEEAWALGPPSIKEGEGQTCCTGLSPRFTKLFFPKAVHLCSSTVSLVISLSPLVQPSAVFWPGQLPSKPKERKISQGLSAAGNESRA